MLEHLRVPVVTAPYGAEEPPPATGTMDDGKNWQVIPSRCVWLSRQPWKPGGSRRAHRYQHAP
jgi:hypothetical protein